MVSGSKNIEVREKVRTHLIAWIHFVVTSSEPVSLLAFWHLYAFVPLEVQYIAFCAPEVPGSRTSKI